MQIGVRDIRLARASADLQKAIESLATREKSAVVLADDMLRLLEIRITAIWTWGHKVVADRLIPARVRKKSGDRIVVMR